MAKVVVITGAGAGAGRATVEEFAREGFDVGLLSRDAARLERAANDVRRYGVNALPIPTDVTILPRLRRPRIGSKRSSVQSTFGSMSRWRRYFPPSPS
ncbi:SDR family NAD(P)-dependent oxidoreductase [Mesorhizobium sp. ESP7-2]|uniref:SDR family NAD(P)-dependent oxidoreductase n=1 Tax=Mesorhizobium sp. ESP7-2 TaxID=2876622 RepID=UPI001AED68A9|nr:SDR family NAD(P)-dependent oxidoreductase [Mesorhizobium sp. ESP7-2]MBZ9710382.1 SDR family NAD(P)-dependent oxidoreductase [Mesorhizobium sp. ESP7-2]